MHFLEWKFLYSGSDLLKFFFPTTHYQEQQWPRSFSPTCKWLIRHQWVNDYVLTMGHLIEYTYSKSSALKVLYILAQRHYSDSLWVSLLHCHLSIHGLVNMWFSYTITKPVTTIYYCDTAWASIRSRLPAELLFIEQLVQANSKETYKLSFAIDCLSRSIMVTVHGKNGVTCP